MVLTDQQALWACIAVLLSALFLLRRRSRLEGESARVRRMPVSEEELGRIVFEVARSADLDGYRGLFLAGREVREALGLAADGYLDARTLTVVEESLVCIGARIPERSHYGACHVMGNQASIEVRVPGGETQHVAIGTIVRVGGVWRLQDPVRD